MSETAIRKRPSCAARAATSLRRADAGSRTGAIAGALIASRDSACEIPSLNVFFIRQLYLQQTHPAEDRGLLDAPLDVLGLRAGGGGLHANFAQPPRPDSAPAIR